MNGKTAGGEDTEILRPAIAVSADGTHHVLTGGPGDISVAEDLTEYRSAKCGGRFTGPFLGSPGQRLADAHRRGEGCETCMKWLRENDVTVPGYMVEGEVLDIVE